MQRAPGLSPYFPVRRPRLEHLKASERLSAGCTQRRPDASASAAGGHRESEDHDTDQDPHADGNSNKSENNDSEDQDDVEDDSHSDGEVAADSDGNGDDHDAEEAGVNGTNGRDEIYESDEAKDDSEKEKSDDEYDPATVRQQHLQVVGQSVRVDPPEVWHSNWDAWLLYLEEYSQRTMQVLVVKETMSTAERNKRTLATKKGQRGEGIIVPDELSPYQRVYICTHGWDPARVRPKSKNMTTKRPRRHVRYTGCAFRFVVQWCPSAEGWRLQVKCGLFIHNHSVTPDTYGTYPKSRGVSDARVEARVDGMLAVGAKRSKIYDYLLAHDQNVIKSDVDNMVRSHRTSVSSVDDNDATAVEVAAFAAENPENVVSVDETEAGETGVISLSTAHMRAIYARFPEFLLVDCSHKTNRHNYQLCTFMGMNEFGEGIPVQQSLLEANGDWHMERAIAHFKRVHSTRIKMLRVIIVDKDLNEIRVLQEHFPEARVLICHFHVLKYLKEMRARPEYGKISTDDASSVDAAVHKMVYARTAAVYEEGRSSLRGICGRIGLDSFFDYFERNWNTCQDMWVMYRRATLPHFRNHTNNRLESFFGKFKGGDSSAKSMAECVKALIACDKRSSNEYKYKLSRVGRYVNAGYDEELANVLRFTTHFVTDHIAVQYAIGLEKANEYVFERDDEDDGVMLVRGQSNTHRLVLLDWMCDCEFAVCMQLPCRHAIAYRKRHKLRGSVIPWNRIDERWTCPETKLTRISQFEYHAFDATESERAFKKVRSRNDRYREAVRATHLIASELADICDETEFDLMLKFVMDQWRNVRQCKRVAVVPAPVPDIAPPDALVELSQTHSLRSEELEGVHYAGVDHVAGFNVDAQWIPSTGRGALTPVKPKPLPQLQTPAEIAVFKNVVANQKKRAAGNDTRVNDNSRSSSSDDGETPPKVKIRINPKTRRVGRPQKKKSKTMASERADRVWYQASESGRRQAGEVTLRALADALDREKPGLAEMQRRLSGVMIKYTSAETKKPKFKVMKNPVLVLDAFYILPPKLLEACMKVLPQKNTSQTAVIVDVSTPQSRLSHEVVHIKDVGTYARDQIETFRRVENMKHVVQLGIDLHKWLLEKALPSLPADMHHLAEQAANKVMRTYPYTPIDGLQNCPDYMYTMLYRCTPPTWLSDACISALCNRLAASYPSTRYGGLLVAEPRNGSHNRHVKPPRLPDDFIRRVRRQVVDETDVLTVLVPVNFANAHWCGIVILVPTKRIVFYDPLNQPAYLNACEDLARSIELQALPSSNMDVVALTNPIQFDWYSCGVFVAWMFVRMVVPDAPREMNGNALTRRRFELMWYILMGSFPAQSQHADLAGVALTHESQTTAATEGEDNLVATQVSSLRE